MKIDNKIELNDLNIGVIGNCYFDEIFDINKFPTPDSKITAKSITITLGGSATNFACGLTKFGLETKLIANLGTDKAASLILQELEDRNINSDLISQIGGQTGRTIILLDELKNSTKIGYPGVSDHLNEMLIDKLSSFPKFDVLHLASVSVDTVKLVVSSGISKFVSLDFGAKTLQASNEEIWEVLKMVDLAFLNRGVFSKLSPNENLSKEVIDKILFANNVVITAGNKGVYAKIEDETFYQPIIEVDVTDTTGAGDATASAIIWGLLNNKTWDINLYHANIASGLKIQVSGGTNGHVGEKDIEEYISNIK